MRQQHDILQRRQPFGDCRFELVDVEAGRGDRAVLQRLDERLLVHHVAARRIDEDRGALRLLQPPAIEPNASLMM